MEACSFMFAKKRQPCYNILTKKGSSLWVNGGNSMIAERINILPDSQIQTIGINALKNALGVTGTLKFLEQFDDGGSGDYTKEKYCEEDVKLNKEEILNMFK